MKNLWISLVRNYITIGLFFYYKRINVHGVENIPKKGAVLFVSNHQNALIDPLLIGTTNGRNTHFLTRAGVFKKKLIIKFFHSVQMIPIYRVRDGWNTLSKNEAIFNKCTQLLNNKEALVIFPEGGHNLQRRIRPLSKGFTRILFGAYKSYPELDIQIIPVGLNYNSIMNYPASVSIYYGKPFSVKEHWDEENLPNSANIIKKVVRDQMIPLTTHIESSSDYDKIHYQLNHTGTNFLDPKETNLKIKSLELSTKNYPGVKQRKNIIYFLFVANSIIPWLLWKKAASKIKEKEFVSTFRFGLGITLFPTFYAAQAMLIYSQFNLKFALSYFGISILLGLILTKISKNAKDKL